MKNRSFLWHSYFSCVCVANYYVKVRLTAKKGRRLKAGFSEGKVMTNKRQRNSLMKEIFFILRMKNRSYLTHSWFFCILFENCYVESRLAAKKGRRLKAGFSKGKVMTNKHVRYSLMKEIFFILRMKNRSYLTHSCFSCILFENCYVETLINV